MGAAANGHCYPRLSAADRDWLDEIVLRQLRLATLVNDGLRSAQIVTAIEGAARVPLWFRYRSAKQRSSWMRSALGRLEARGQVTARFIDRPGGCGSPERVWTLAERP